MMGQWNKARLGKTGLCAAALLAIVTVMGSPALAETISLDPTSPSYVGSAQVLNPGLSTHLSATTLGLLSTDNLDAMSPGLDAVQYNNIIYFSVDRASVGVVGDNYPLDVNGQAALNQAAGDVFVTTDADGMGHVPLGVNALYANQNFYGEQPKKGPTKNNTGPQDNMDALSFEEFDLDGNGAQDLGVYFSLDKSSPSLGGYSAADILLSPVGGGSFSLFASAASMGLDPDDDLDALVLLDLGTHGTLDTGDVALFSLAPGSPTLAALGASAADIFMTSFDGGNFVRYSAASLGLLATDNVDALEVGVPEPATLSLMVLGGVAMLRRRRVGGGR